MLVFSYFDAYSQIWKVTVNKSFLFSRNVKEAKMATNVGVMKPRLDNID